MKSQMLFAVWGLLAVYASCAAVEPVGVAELAVREVAEEPVEIIESYEEINLDYGYTGPVSRSNVLLVRVIARRNAVANAVIVHTIKYTGRSSTRISSVHWWQLTSLGSTARLVAGGANRNTVTVEIRSARGRGIHYQVDVYGRY